ncbi:MAG TPA: hypothetical protein VFV92_02160, partial [Candidatus Bathyarchaeia archaeon]|nr:hypothetical protein [Candidatus Bathyarchaeia archaeon]
MPKRQRVLSEWADRLLVLRADEVGLSRRKRHSGTAWKCADTTQTPAPGILSAMGIFQQLSEVL